MQYKTASQVDILFLITLNAVLLYGVKIEHTKLQREMFSKEAEDGETIQN